MCNLERIGCPLSLLTKKVTPSTVLSVHNLNTFPRPHDCCYCLYYHYHYHYYILLLLSSLLTIIVALITTVTSLSKITFISSGIQISRRTMNDVPFGCQIPTFREISSPDG